MWYVQKQTTALARAVGGGGGTRARLAHGITGTARRGAGRRAPRAPVTPASSASRPARARASARRRLRPGYSPQSPSMSQSCPSSHRCASSRAWRGGRTAWTSCCTLDMRISSHPCACAGVAVARRNAWTACHKITNCTRTVALRCASEDEPSDGMFCHKPFHSLVCDSCVYFFS